ncbi:hypothetical protein CMQ_6467 [Grosmannia clavigera kw1407]|uniref:Uncharacterized protein n=1 Tax=Grosmannia clavigera (strain kw1407 / UAMH 11150) TaxID=655863 RepID=F0XMM2_GROCL|nr:uncharacterized protein CMQ_6467 [Grosmannia clavigera kw1407]EFX01525.1 hypothetical protein CMQ_6467 [Grosmannia clavigera kw1407]
MAGEDHHGIQAAKTKTKREAATNMSRQFPHSSCPNAAILSSDISVTTQSVSVNATCYRRLFFLEAGLSALTPRPH